MALTSITRIPNTIRNVGRIYDILKVLARHGFDDVVDRLGIESAWQGFKRRVSFGRWGRADEAVRHLTVEERIRLIFEELGPTYIKFGQILATRPDLVPMSLIQELRKLQDDVPPFDPEVARKIVEVELGGPVEQFFRRFEPEPIAAASIAQVHRAELPSGERVVVKIQRPHLREILKRDLDLLRQLAALFERDPELRRWQPLALVEEFEKSIYKEIDFGRELHNIKKFAGIFADDPSVYVPSVYEDLSTERVLTMEFIDGIKVSSDRLREQPWFDPEVVAHNGVRMILVQLFEHGFFHADPHPGNLFILPDNVICPIDYGMMGLLDQERIDELLLFLVALLTQNAERMVRLLERQGIVGEHVDTGALKTDLLDLMDRWLGVDLARIDVAVYIQAIFDVITRHRIMLPPDLLLMGKALATIDGVARDIYPQLDPIEAMRPHVLRIYFRRLTAPEFYLRDTRRALEDSVYLAQRLPRIVHQVLLQLRDGRLLVRNEPSEPTLERILRERNRAANRQAVALLIVGGGAISSYLLIHGQGWLPWLGGLGYVAAAVLGLYFVFGLLRSGGQ